jgi:hypothetical protein
MHCRRSPPGGAQRTLRSSEAKRWQRRKSVHRPSHHLPPLPDVALSGPSLVCDAVNRNLLVGARRRRYPSGCDAPPRVASCLAAQWGTTSPANHVILRSAATKDLHYAPRQTPARLAVRPRALLMQAVIPYPRRRPTTCGNKGKWYNVHDHSATRASQPLADVVHPLRPRR